MKSSNIDWIYNLTNIAVTVPNIKFDAIYTLQLIPSILAYINTIDNLK